MTDTSIDMIVLRLARSVLGDLDVSSVLERIIESAQGLTGAQYAGLGVLDESRELLERFITAGIDDPTRRAIGPLPTGRGVLGELIRKPEPLRLADVGLHPRSYGFPIDHPPMRSFLGVPVLVDGKPYGNLYLTEKQTADEFTEEDEAAVVVLAEFAGIAIDHARRFSGSETRHKELEHTIAALNATIQISRAVGGQTDLNAILELVAKRGRALVSARALVIELRRGEELVVAASAGDVPRDLIGRRMKLADSVASGAMRTLTTQRLEDEPNRIRFERHDLGQLGLRAQAGLVVPLAFRGATFGVLVAIDRVEDGPHFSSDDEQLLQAFATSAATATPRRSPSSPSAEANGSPRRSRSARAGHASCTTRRSKAWPRFASAWAPRSGPGRPTRSQTLCDRRSRSLTARSPAGARSSPTFGPRRSIRSTRRPRSRHSRIAPASSGSKSMCISTSHMSRHAPLNGSMGISRPRSAGSSRKRSPTRVSTAGHSAPSWTSERARSRSTCPCAMTARDSSHRARRTASALSACGSEWIS